MTILFTLSAIGAQKQEGIFHHVIAHGMRAKLLTLFQLVRIERSLFSVTSLKSNFSNLTSSPLAIRNHLDHLAREAESRSLKQFLHDGFDIGLSYKAWEQAKEKNDFFILAPKLKKVVAGVRYLDEFKKAAMGFKSSYDARLDRLTPGMSSEVVDRLIARILPYRDRLQSIPAQYTDHQDTDFSCPKDTQIKVIKNVLQALGLNEDNTDLYNGNYHPLAFLINNRLKITHNINPTDIVQSVLDVVHEAGHGLFRLHMGEDSQNSFLNMTDMYYHGPDETTAFIFEQYICRTPEFAHFLHQQIKEAYDENEMEAPSFNQVYSRLMSDAGGLQRAKSCSTRYPFFLFQYYEIEKKLYEREIEVKDIPAEWQELSIKYHGWHVTDDPNQNVLQDPHWSTGEFGRFAGGYLPGLMMAAQMFETMIMQQPEALAEVARGNFTNIINWCKENIYTQDRRATFQDFVRHATGNELDPDAYLRVELAKEKYAPRHVLLQRPKHPPASCGLF